MGGELSFFHLHISHYAPYLPNKFCIAFHFSWVLQLSQEKLKTMLMQNYGGRGGGGGGANKVHYGRCASGVLGKISPMSAFGGI